MIRLFTKNTIVNKHPHKLHNTQKANFMKKIITLATLALCLVACGKDTQTSETTQQATPSTTASPANNEHNPNYPTYAVGSEIGYEPFSFKDEQRQATGFEVELLQAIGRASKFNVTFIDTPRSQAIETLNNGQFQIWASALSISSERKEQMDMSDPYLDFSREIYILDKPENTNIKTLADLQGKIISVNQNSKSSADTATQITGNASNVLLADGFFMSLQNTIQGKADGTLGDSRVLQYYQLKFPNTKTRTISIGEEKKYIAFAVRKGNTELLNQINQGLATIKADGTYNQLVEKWFGYQNKK